MAIAFVNEDSTSNASSTSLTPTEYASAAEDDIVFLLASIDSTDGTAFTVNSEWTAQSQSPIESLFANNDSHVGIWFLRRGSGAPTSYNVSYDGTAAQMRVSCLGFSGVNTTDALDVTYVSGTHANQQNNVLYPPADAAQPITTATDNAMAVLIQVIRQNTAGTMAAPTNYSLDLTYNNNSRCHNVATDIIVSNGVETPGDWGHTDVADAADSANFTIALKPASGEAITIEIPTGPWR